MKRLKVFYLVLLVSSISWIGLPSLEAACGSCSVSSDPAKNTAKCVKCVNDEGDACIQGTGGVKCCLSNCGGGIN